MRVRIGRSRTRRYSPPTHVLIRGNAGSLGPEVQPAFISVLNSPKPSWTTRTNLNVSSGRRLALAEWIGSPTNPLTARVIANRIWQHHFGQGLAKTTSDFGKAGTPPTHPELLDWLAAEFVEHGWSIKKLHKTILLSQAYQMSSRNDHSSANQIDPGNQWLWRQNLRRLEAEAIRDTLLAISGQLNLQSGGRGYFPRLSGEVLAGQSRPGQDWDLSDTNELTRRSVYAYVRRTMAVPMLEVFDYNNTTSPLSERSITTVAPQALLLLNDDFVQQQALALSHRIQREAGTAADRFIQQGFLLALGRSPTPSELQTSEQFIRRQNESFKPLTSRLIFRPAVPTSLSENYMGKLKPNDYLSGPPSGWTYHMGRWSAAYEGIRTVEDHQGPFALAPIQPFVDGLVQASLTLHHANESASLLLRSTATNHVLNGYELALDPRAQKLILRRHHRDVVTLAEITTTLPTAQPIHIKAQLNAQNIRVWLNHHPLPTLNLTDAHPLLNPGQIGATTSGAAVSIDYLTIEPLGAKAVSLRDSTLPSSTERAFRAFCLLLLNLNEVAYLD
ncbi:MAG: DUF1553 domain-containing protein [Pedosphaera sp.]|nr:DUF1553 domain-containing protein [Pedosphaera sp.]